MARRPGGSGRRNGELGPAAVIDATSDPVLVVDGEGEVVAANRSFRQTFGDGGEPATCCDAVCSRVVDGAGDECLGRATAADGRRRTVRVRTATSEVTVRTSRLKSNGDMLAVFRFDAPAPAARPPSSARLRVHTLGQLRAEVEDGPDLGEDWIPHRSGQLLGFLVATRGRLVPNDEVAEALWPSLGAAGPSTVRHAIHVLRTKLEPDRGRGEPSRYVIVRRGRYLLNLASVWIDADAFETTVQSALDAYLAGDAAAAERGMLSALRLYRGEFLADQPYADWAIDERERLHERALLALRVLIDVELSRGDLAAAADDLERLTRMEPLDAEAHRRCLTVLVRLGRHSRAMRHYDAFAARLRRDIGKSPPYTLADVVRDAGDSATAEL